VHEIIPGRLWVGNSRDARNAKALLDAGVNAVVDLAVEETPASLPREIVYLRFPLVDGSSNSQALLLATIRSVANLLGDTSFMTAVCCGAGLSRAPSIAAAVLAMINDDSPESSLERIRLSVACDVSPSFWADVCYAVEKARGREQ
jgi:hypothetical protein